jgi:hypothetical protein
VRLVVDDAYLGAATEPLDTAVFEAFKTFEVEIRAAANLGNDLVGQSLASRAFHSESGPLTDFSAERVALMNPMTGALGSYIWQTKRTSYVSSPANSYRAGDTTCLRRRPSRVSFWRSRSMCRIGFARGFGSGLSTTSALLGGLGWLIGLTGSLPASSDSPTSPNVDGIRIAGCAVGRCSWAPLALAWVYSPWDLHGALLGASSRPLSHREDAQPDGPARANVGSDGMGLLNLWELTPIELESELWEFSTYRGRVFVRARDGEHARAITAENFSTGRHVLENHVSAGSPWHSDKLVRCACVDVALLDGLGAAVVSPHR